jgi:hypothetical protein
VLATATLTRAGGPDEDGGGNWKGSWCCSSVMFCAKEDFALSGREWQQAGARGPAETNADAAMDQTARTAGSALRMGLW